MRVSHDTQGMRNGRLRHGMHPGIAPEMSIAAPFRVEGAATSTASVADQDRLPRTDLRAVVTRPPIASAI